MTSSIGFAAGLLILGLGCAGLGRPAPGPPAVADPAVDWVDAVAEEAVAWEIMPGTTAPENPERPAQLRVFFAAHPEYADPARRALLADLACAFGVEQGHERLLHPAPREALVVDVEAADWRVVVAHADGWCTSDDWSWFTNSVDEAVRAEGVTTAYGGAIHDALVVRRGGVEVGRYPLTGQGYLMVAAGRSPGEAGHDQVDGVLREVSDYFGSSFATP